MLRESDLLAIGAHVYGGPFNSASVIGQYGKSYDDYLAAFNLSIPKDGGLHLVPVRGNNTSTSLPGKYASDATKTMGGPATVPSRLRSKQPNQNGYTPPVPGTPTKSALAVRTSGQPQMNEEFDFFGTLKKAAQIGAPILGNVLNTALPIALGPIGAPIEALAGFALSAAGKLSENTGVESSAAGTDPLEGSVERAVLAEATLSAIQNMDLSEDVEESILSVRPSPMTCFNPARSCRTITHLF